MTVSLVVANIIPLRLMIPNILAQCAGAAAAAVSATKLRGYPTGAIPIAPDGDIWTIFVVEGIDAFLSQLMFINKFQYKSLKLRPI